MVRDRQMCSSKTPQPLLSPRELCRQNRPDGREQKREEGKGKSEEGRSVGTLTFPLSRLLPRVQSLCVSQYVCLTRCFVRNRRCLFLLLSILCTDLNEWRHIRGKLRGDAISRNLLQILHQTLPQKHKLETPMELDDFSSIRYL